MHSSCHRGMQRGNACYRPQGPRRLSLEAYLQLNRARFSRKEEHEEEQPYLTGIHVASCFALSTARCRGKINSIHQVKQISRPQLGDDALQPNKHLFARLCQKTPSTFTQESGSTRVQRNTLQALASPGASQSECCQFARVSASEA